MTFWILLWKIVFIVTIAVFLVMAVLVSWFGAGDIRRLLQRLQDDDETTEHLRRLLQDDDETTEHLPPGD